MLGSWYAPGAFFCLLWSLYTIVPLVIAPTFYVWPGGVLAICVACFSVYVGSLTGYIEPISTLVLQSQNACLRVLPTHSATVAKWPGLGLMTVLCSVLGCGAVTVAVLNEGFSLADLVSVDSFMSVGHAFSVARYSADYRPSMGVQFLTLFMYAGALFGGTFFCIAQKKAEKCVALVPFLPAVLFTLIFTTRSSLLLQSVLWFSAYMTGIVLAHGFRGRLFTKRFNLTMFLLAPMALLVMVLALLVRTGEELDLSWMFSMILIDTAGHLAAFSSWLEHAWQIEITPAFGAFTFAGLYELLGISGRIGGLYEDLVEVGAEVGSDPLNNTTNIYTAFRGLIQDVSIPIAPLALLILGCLAGIAFREVACGNKLSVPILAAFYSFCFWSVFVSFTVYNTLIGAYVVFFLYALILKVEEECFRMKADRQT
jgi:oligosaccharide repeat unit polymerase